jgi:hypothetical protein
MIRIRTAEGSLVKPPANSAFIEVLDDDGAIGLLIVQDPINARKITICGPDDVETQTYAKLNKMKTSSIIRIKK